MNVARKSWFLKHNLSNHLASWFGRRKKYNLVLVIWPHLAKQLWPYGLPSQKILSALYQTLRTPQIGPTTEPAAVLPTGEWLAGSSSAQCTCTVICWTLTSYKYMMQNNAHRSSVCPPTFPNSLFCISHTWLIRFLKKLKHCHVWQVA